MKRNNVFRAVMRQIIVMITAITFLVAVVPASAQQNGAQNPDNLPTGYTSSLAQEMGNFGFSTAQPSRKDPAGNVIDKTTNTPFGPNMIVENQTFQLAGAALNIGGDPYDIYSPSLQSSSVSLNNGLLGTSSSSQANWYDVPKAMVGADLVGSGKDDLVTAALTNYNSNTNQCDLEVIVTDYNNGKSVTSAPLILASGFKVYNYGSHVMSPIHIAAGDFDRDPTGKDEVAILVANQLGVYQITPQGSAAPRATEMWGVTYSAIRNTASDWPKMDMAAADTTGDGFADLLVAPDSSNGVADNYTPHLLIYSHTPSTPKTVTVNTTTLPAWIKPTADIPLSCNNGTSAFVSPSMAVGDIFGNGAREIVIAGKTETNASEDMGHDFLTYVSYDPQTQSYDQTLQNPVYPLTISASDPNQNGIDHDGLTGLAIASLDQPGGQPFVAVGQHVFRWDGQSSFVDQNLQGINEGHYTYMLNLVAGNFLGIKGQEQIAMLVAEHTKYYKVLKRKNHANIHLNLIWSSTAPATNWQLANSFGNYPTICATDVENNGVKYTFDKSEFTFSQPTVLALLAATPYYQQLPYSGSLGNVGTSIGTGSSSESAVTNGFTATAGITVGFKQQLQCIVEIGEVESKVEVEGSLTTAWTKSKEVSTEVGYSNYVGNPDESADDVVVAVVPEDIYYYKVADEAGSDTTEMAVTIPYAPETTIMPVTDYNSKVQNDPYAPQVDAKKILGGAQPGNPLSYPGSTDNLSNVSGSGNVVTAGSFKGCGVGNTSVSQQIEESTSSSTSVGGSLTVKASIEADVLGVLVGSSFSTGYSHSTEHTSSNSVTYQGSVAGVPDGYDQTQFQWELVAYNYNLTAGKATQEIHVVNYLVQGAKAQTAAPVITPPVDAGATSVSGTSADDASIVLYDNGTKVGTATAAGSGAWTVGNLSQTLKAGDSLTATAQVSGQVVSADSATVTVQSASTTTASTGGSLDLSVDFQVGTTDHATALVPGASLTAKATITNQQNQALSGQFIVVLYDPNGAMVTYAAQPVSSIPANGNAGATAGFTIPADATSAYTVKAFLWSGADLSSPRLTPLSNVVTLGS